MNLRTPFPKGKRRLPIITTMRILLFAVLFAVMPVAGYAQQTQQPASPRAARSGVATTTVHLDGRQIGDRWAAGASQLVGPSRIEIEYGQPHRRGRTIFGEVVPFGRVWRAGANLATQLHTDVDVRIGETLIPRGSYSLYILPEQDNWTLIVNARTREWGTIYSEEHDVARIPMAVRSLSEPMESFTIWLVPSADAPAAGDLRISWDTTEASVSWSVGD
jgi:hypothetical protein